MPFKDSYAVPLVPHILTSKPIIDSPGTVVLELVYAVVVGGISNVYDHFNVCRVNRHPVHGANLYPDTISILELLFTAPVYEILSLECTFIFQFTAFLDSFVLDFFPFFFFWGVYSRFLSHNGFYKDTEKLPLRQVPVFRQSILTGKKVTMTFQQVVNELMRIAMNQHNVRSAGYGDLFADLNANPSIKYNVFYITPGQSASVGELDRFTLNLFHISRLEDVSGSNMLQLESLAKEIIDNVATMFCDTYGAEIYGTTYYNFFTQRFADLCCGAYAQITFQVPKAAICADD